MHVLGPNRRRVAIYYVSMRVRKFDHPQILFEIRLDLPRPKKPFHGLAGFLTATKMFGRVHFEHAIDQGKLAKVV